MSSKHVAPAGPRAQTEVALLCSMQRIRELEGENADLVQQVAKLEETQADADMKREHWRRHCMDMAENVRIPE